MARALKKVGTVLGAVALVATGIGAVAGTGLLIGGTFISATSIGAAAGLAAGIANIGSMALAKPPPARGSLSQILIQADAPAPYVMGEGYFAGVLRHDTGYGGTVDKVENPYRFLPIVYSVAGPVQSISPRVDYGTVPSWYSSFLYTDTQLGACPESNALAPQWAGAVGWTSSSKLSGQAAIGWSLRFDKAGKRFASGVPLLGAYGQWVKVYDPRLDSTVPGGSGSHRLGTESTYSYSANPALHAGMYAYGRYQNGKRVFGIGLPADAIDWASVSAWANVCDANGWTLFGVAYEPGDRAQNLIDICAAGSGEPCFVNAILSFRYDAPAVALDTITEADLADEPVSVTFMQSYRNRLNTIIPKYRSPSHNWELVAAAAVQVPGYVSEDGEERREEWPFNFVKGVNQAAQLAAYRLVNSRELHPIMIPCGPRLRGYGPGDCLHIDLPQSGLDHNAIILEREFDPATMTTRLTLISETGAKHAFALGQTGTAPPTPALGQTPEDRDETSAGNVLSSTTLMTQIRSAGPTNPRDLSDIEIDLLAGRTTMGGVSAVDVARHDWDYPDDGAGPITRETDTILLMSDGVTPIPPGSRGFVYFDDATLSDGAPEYKFTFDEQEAINSNAHPGRHPLGIIDIPLVGDPPEYAGRGIGYGYY